MTTYEISAVTPCSADRVFLAVRYNFDAALRAAEEFARRWPTRGFLIRVKPASAGLVPPAWIGA